MKFIKSIILVAVVGMALATVAVSMYVNDKLTFYVTGQVKDYKGKPVPSATVVASLGLDNESSPSLTSQDGSFQVSASGNRWYKGPPMIEITKNGFCKHYVHFKPWKFGDRKFDVQVYLKAGPMTATTYSK